MNFSKIINNPELITGVVSYLRSNSNSVKKMYSNYTEPTEEDITNNYVGINKCLNILENLKSLESLAKCQFTEIRNDLDFTLNAIKANLNSIAETLKPESYKKDCNKILKYLGFRNLNPTDSYSIIYPMKDKVALSTVFSVCNRNLVFSTIYSDKDSSNYINYDVKECLPGYFDLGTKIIDNYNSVLDSYIYNKPLDRIEDLIKKSEVFDNFIKSSVRERCNIKQVQKVISSYFNDCLSTSYIHNTEILFKFTKVDDRKAKEIAKILKLNNNDTYKFFALQKE